MYELVIVPAALKQLKKLPAEVRTTIVALIDDLATNPRPSGVKKLKGHADRYRVRKGDYRVVYSIEDDVLVVTVIKVGHRSKIYEK